MQISEHALTRTSLLQSCRAQTVEQHDYINAHNVSDPLLHVFTVNKTEGSHVYSVVVLTFQGEQESCPTCIPLS